MKRYVLLLCLLIALMFMGACTHIEPGDETEDTFLGDTFSENTSRMEKYTASPGGQNPGKTFDSVVVQLKDILEEDKSIDYSFSDIVPEDQKCEYNSQYIFPK